MIRKLIGLGGIRVSNESCFSFSKFAASARVMEKALKMVSGCFALKKCEEAEERTASDHVDSVYLLKHACASR